MFARCLVVDTGDALVFAEVNGQNASVRGRGSRDRVHAASSSWGWWGLFAWLLSDYHAPTACMDSFGRKMYGSPSCQTSRGLPRKEKLMRYVLSVLLWVVLLPVALAQDNEAEKLFRDMEKKILAAKSFEVPFDYQIENRAGEKWKWKTKGTLLVTKDNKAQLKIIG